MTGKSAAVQVVKEPTSLKTAIDRANALFEAISRRAYEKFAGSGYMEGHELDDWFAAEHELLHPIPINISESGEALEITAEVPGFSEKELEVSVEPRRLVISGKRETKREEKQGTTVYSEICADQIMRVVHLPTDVETENVTASLKDGVLDLNLPKLAKARSIRFGESRTAA